jgi:DNA repair protein RadC
MICIREEVSGPKILSGEDALAYWWERVARQSWCDCEREVVVVLCLNTKYRVLGFALVSLGTVNESIVHPRDVFAPAIALNAFAILLLHNHPSGEPAPSTSDDVLTRRLTDAAELMQIKLLDHIIVGDRENFFSFFDR